MLAATSRQVSLALFLCAIFAGLSPGQAAAEDSTLYTLGKYTAYARHCGHHGLAMELQSRYGDQEDFKIGRRRNDLQKYDSVSLACGRLEDILVDFLEKERAKEAK